MSYSRVTTPHSEKNPLNFGRAASGRLPKWHLIAKWLPLYPTNHFSLFSLWRVHGSGTTALRPVWHDALTCATLHIKYEAWRLHMCDMTHQICLSQRGAEILQRFKRSTQRYVGGGTECVHMPRARTRVRAQRPQGPYMHWCSNTHRPHRFPVASQNPEIYIYTGLLYEAPDVSKR